MPNGAVVVDAEVCPVANEDFDGKIFDEGYLRDHPHRGQRVTIWLQDAIHPALPMCGSAGSQDGNATCEARDAALQAEVVTNVQEFNCILADGLNLRTSGDISKALADSLNPVYWDAPYHLTGGRPVPLLVAFESVVTWQLAQQIAQHPYVARVEPAMGEVSSAGVKSPPPPEDCPLVRETAMPKLSQATALQGAGRKTVVIAMKSDALPVQVDCPTTGSSSSGQSGCAGCEAKVNREWERYLLNRREVTCVDRALDAVVGPGGHSVSFAEVVGSPCTPPIPPLNFSATPSVLAGFGWALTWDEAEKVAAHPFVESIRMQDLADGSPPDGCPLDTQARVPKPNCVDARESTSGKWSAPDQARWQASSGSNVVVVQVRGGRTVCPTPDCPPLPNECPELQEDQAYLEDWNWQSQTCVRALISQLGGQATDERFWLVDTVVASLTWSQIQAVGAHPHVVFIQSNDSGAPPP